jgi:hypothetical protein
MGSLPLGGIRWSNYTFLALVKKKKIVIFPIKEAADGGAHIFFEGKAIVF